MYVAVPCEDVSTYVLSFRTLVSATSEESESVPATYIYQCPSAGYPPGVLFPNTPTSETN